MPFDGRDVVCASLVSDKGSGHEVRWGTDSSAFSVVNEKQLPVVVGDEQMPPSIGPSLVDATGNVRHLQDGHHFERLRVDLYNVGVV